MYIEATNAHGENDPNYLSRFGILTQDENGRAFIKRFLSIKWHLSLVKYPSKRWAWSDDPLKVQHEIKKIMPFKTFQVMAKHFSVVKKDQLPSRQDPDYHPLRNISGGVDVLKNNSVALWKSGRTLCIDEGRVRSKSNRNPFRIFNPEKPLKWDGLFLKGKLVAT